MGRGTLNTNEAVCVDLSEEADLWPLSSCLYFSVLHESDSRRVLETTAVQLITWS